MSLKDHYQSKKRRLYVSGAQPGRRGKMELPTTPKVSKSGTPTDIGHSVSGLHSSQDESTFEIGWDNNSPSPGWPANGGKRKKVSRCATSKGQDLSSIIGKFSAKVKVAEAKPPLGGGILLSTWMKTELVKYASKQNLNEENANKERSSARRRSTRSKCNKVEGVQFKETLQKFLADLSVKNALETGESNNVAAAGYRRSPRLNKDINLPGRSHVRINMSDDDFLLEDFDQLAAEEDSGNRAAVCSDALTKSRTTSVPADRDPVLPGCGFANGHAERGLADGTPCLKKTSARAKLILRSSSGKKSSKAGLGLLGVRGSRKSSQRLFDVVASGKSESKATTISLGSKNSGGSTEADFDLSDEPDLFIRASQEVETLAESRAAAGGSGKTSAIAASTNHKRNSNAEVCSATLQASRGAVLPAFPKLSMERPCLKKELLSGGTTDADSVLHIDCSASTDRVDRSRGYENLVESSEQAQSKNDVLSSPLTKALVDIELGHDDFLLDYVIADVEDGEVKFRSQETPPRLSSDQRKLHKRCHTSPFPLDAKQACKLAKAHESPLAAAPVKVEQPNGGVKLDPVFTAIGCPAGSAGTTLHTDSGTRHLQPTNLATKSGFSFRKPGSVSNEGRTTSRNQIHTNFLTKSNPPSKGGCKNSSPRCRPVLNKENGAEISIIENSRKVTNTTECDSFMQVESQDVALSSVPMASTPKCSTSDILRKREEAQERLKHRNRLLMSRAQKK